MTSEEKLALAIKHAPILWLHENEAFLPVDCQRMVDNCDFYRKNRRVPDNQQPQTIDALGKVRNSDECSFVMPGIDLKTFQVSGRDRIRLGLSGPEAVKQLAREKYGRDLKTRGIPRRGSNQPKYYCRVSTSRIQKLPDDQFTRVFEFKDSAIFGVYTHIEYFFYFEYNDSWNQHQGDWDAMVELFIRPDRTYMVNHFHTVKWVTAWPKTQRTINAWIDLWQSRKKDGEAYLLKNHPYVFLAQGAHGGYPTPGFSLHGKNLPDLFTSKDFMADTDMRQIGRFCILPPDVQENEVRDNLIESGIDTSRLVFGIWGKPELIENQPWLQYRGRWGQEVKLHGWDAPKDPPITKQPRNITFKKWILKDYYSGSVIANWHGV